MSLPKLMETFRDSQQHGGPWQTNAKAVWTALSPVQRETLTQLLQHGPVWDGDVVSKSARDDLIEIGLAVRCCFKGEQGHAAASYAAYTVHRCGQGQ